MSFPPKKSLQKSERQTIPDLVIPKGRLCTPTIKLRNKNEEKMLFETKDIEAKTLNFDIVAPACEDCDASLESHNPGLYAFRNMTAKGPKRSQKSPKVPRAKTAMGKSSVLVRQITKPQPGPPKIPALDKARQITELEKLTINFKEDPVAYFSKRRDGRGHKFIYLVYKDNPKDPFFSPYDLQKVPFSQCGQEYFMMSATGVTHYFDQDNTETIPLDQWSQEASTFQSIRKLKFFAQYFFWKSFKIWKQFVMFQRYGGISTKIVDCPHFRNTKFFQGIVDDSFKISTLDPLIGQYLLSFNSQAGYPIEVFESKTKHNLENLRAEYTVYIKSVVATIKNLYSQISDPKLVQVFDTDFSKDVRRRNPNLTQLISLEKKKAALRASKTETVNQEIISLGPYIRTADYMILEALTAGCFKYWHQAEATISQDKNCIFQVEVFYTENGEVSLSPTKSNLIETVTKALDESVKVLNALPRLVQQPAILPHLRDSGLNLVEFNEKGPMLYKMVRCTDELDKIQDHIVSVISSSYEEAEAYAKSQFSDYYAVYQLADSWKATDYLKTRSGKPYTGSLDPNERTGNGDEFLLNFDEEPDIDFAAVEKDMYHFKSQVTQVAKLPTSGAKGAIIINSSNIKEFMGPVLDKTIHSLTEMLLNLENLKDKLCDKAFKYYKSELRKEPQTLQQYVKFCELIQKTIAVTPNLETEIQFISRAHSMFEHFGMDKNFRNVHEEAMVSFKADIAAAQAIKAAHFNTFTKPLSAKIKEMEEKLQLFYEKATALPGSIKEANVDERYPLAKQLLQQVLDTRPEIDQILYYQKTIGANITNLDLFNAVIDVSNFAVSLYESLQLWASISAKMRETPLVSLKIEDFKTDVNGLLNTVTQLSNNAKITYPILAELISCVQETAGFMHELELLAYGKMRQANWISLFKATGNPPSQYHEQITINELVNLGILKEKEKIAEITHISHGEYEVFSEFEKVSSEWQKVQMPFVEVAFRTEETLKLGDIKPIIEIINKNISIYTQMFLNPYVGGIKDNIIEELNDLEYYSNVLELWRTFQNNWNILSSLFSNDEARSLMPQHSNRIIGIQRKWAPIGKHALSDTRVVAACSFPQLRSIFTEMNQSLESILCSLGKFLDTKRTAIPRLFFLKNEDVLLFLSTNLYSVLRPILSKLFMNIADFDVHETQAARNDQSSYLYNIQRLRIFGMVGKNGDQITFQRPISCNIQVEQWMKQLIDSMKSSVKDLVSNNINMCTGTQLSEWFLSIPEYIGFTVLNIVFTREVRDLINAYESNSTVFDDYLVILKLRIDDASNSIAVKTKPQEKAKLGQLLIILVGFRDRINQITSNKEGINLTEWKHTMQFNYHQNNSTITIEFGDYIWEHGYEFYGSIPPLIHTPSIDAAKASILYSLSQDYVPSLIGTESNGKIELLSSIAAEFGKFFYIFYPMTSENEIMIGRMTMGAATSDSWVAFASINTMSNISLSVLHDTIRSLSSAISAKNQRITIASRFIELNKNARLFLTADSNFENNTEIPQQLKSYVRTTAIRDPDYQKICCIKLLSAGFHQTEELASKIITIVETGINLIVPISGVSFIKTIYGIIQSAIRYVKEAESEEFAIAMAAFNQFIQFVDKDSYMIIVSTIYASLPIGESPKELMERIKKYKRIEPVITQIEKEIKLMGMDIPADYLIAQASSLIKTIYNNKTIIIVGPPNSGKTLVMSLIEKVLDRKETRDQVEGAYKTLINTVFHESDTPHAIFGKVFDDQAIGYSLLAGQVDAALYSLAQQEGEYIRILRFDGKITPELMQFISCFTRSNTMPQIKIVVETDSLEGVSPSLLARSSVIYMKNAQESLFSTNICTLDHPLLPLSRATSALSKIINASQIEKFKSFYCNTMPVLIKKLYQTDNLICSASSKFKIPGGNLILTDIIPMFVAMLSLYQLSEEIKDMNNDNNIATVLAWSFISVVSGIIRKDLLKGIDTFIRTTFDIQIPLDWSGYDLPPSFKQEYPFPTLLSLDPSHSSLKPIYLQKDRKVYTPGPDESLPVNPSHVTIVPDSWLRDISVASKFLKMEQHLIIHGSPKSGKTSFVRSLLHWSDENRRALIISASPVLNGENLTSYIKRHTSLMSLTVSPDIASLIVYLVFENVSPKDTILIGYITSILKMKKVPIYSKNDQKTYELISLRNFRVIITTNQYYTLPSRFLSNFIPIHVADLGKESSTFVSTNLLSMYGFDQKTRTFILDFFTKCLSKIQGVELSHCLIKLSQDMCSVDDKKNAKQIMMAMIFSLLREASHLCQMTQIYQIMSDVLSLYKNKEIAESSSLFLERDIIINPKFEFSHNSSSLKAVYSAQSVEKLIKELDYMLSVINTSSIYKLSAKINYYNLSTWIQLSTTFNTPGHHAVVLGEPGSGRFTITQLAASTGEFDFVNILPATPEEALSPHERIESISNVIREIVTNAVLNHKKTVIFVRSTSENANERSLIKAFVSNYDFVPFYSDQELDELYLHFSNITNPTPEQRMMTMIRIRGLLETSVHLVLSVENRDFNKIRASFDIIKPFDEPTVMISEVINNFMNDDELPESIRTKSKEITKSLKKILTVSSKVHQKTTINMFHDLLMTLKLVIKHDIESVDLRHRSLESALKFIENVKNDNIIINKRMKEIEPKIDRIRLDAESLEQSYITRKEAIEARRIKLQDDRVYKEDKLKQTADKLDKLEKDHSFLLPQYEKAEQGLQQMLPSEILTIKMTLCGQQHKSIVTIFELLAILLDLQKPYYENATKLLDSPAFIEKISGLTISKLEPKKLKRCKEILDEANINPVEIENICLPIRPIYDFLDALMKLSELNGTLELTKKQHEEESRQLTEFLEEMDLEKQSISQVEESLVAEKQQVSDSLAKKENMEKEFASIKERKENVDKVITDIEALEKTWKFSGESFETQKTNILGDAISLSFYLVFCGSLPQDKRVSLMNEVVEILKSSGINTSVNDPVDFINDRFILNSACDDLISFETAPCQSVVIDVQHLFTTIRTPLLIDPDGIITSFIIDSIKPKRIITVSATSSTLETCLQTAVSDGKILVLLDVDSLYPAIEQAMLIPLIDEKTSSREIKIGTKVVQWDPKFKMILVSSKSAETLPDDLITRVVTIDVSSSSQETTKKMFVNMFVDFFSPSLTSRVTDMRKKELGKRVLVQKYENDILDTLSDIAATKKMNPGYDYLADKDIITDIITSKESYFSYISGNTDFTSLKNELAEAVKPFQQHVDLCQIFWTALSRYVAVVNPAARVSFSGYIKYISSLFVNSGLHAGTLSADQHSALHNTLITSSFSYIFPSLKISEMYFFMFVSGFLIGKDSGKLNDEDFDSVVEHICNERMEICDFANNDSSDVGSFEGLKFTNILNVFNYIKNFISQQFGEGISPVFPHFQVENIVSNTGSVPTVIVAPPEVDPSGMIINFIGQRCRHDNFDEISLSDDPETINSSRKLVMTSMSRGNWVLLHYSKPNRAAGQLITDLFTLMTTSINTNFRLIVICSSLEYIAQSILLRAKKFTIDDSGSLRNTMLQFFGHHNSQILSTSNPQGIKRASYLALLGTCFTIFKNNIHPIAFSSPIKPHELAVKDALKELHMLADSYINGMPPSIISSHLTKILFSSVTNSYDYKSACALVKNIFRNQMFDDGYTIADDTETDAWHMPGDIPLSNYTQVIQKLPLFPTAAVYRMNSFAGRHIVSWTLSQIITEPFLGFMKKSSKITPENVLQRTDNLEMIIPDLVDYPSSIAWTMRTLFLRTEIKKFNKALTHIRSTLAKSKMAAEEGIVDSVGSYIARGKVPPSWKKEANFFSTNQANKFASHIVERHALLTSWAQGVIPSSVNAALIDDVNGLLLSFINEVALRHNYSQNSLAYEFTVGASSTPEDSIVLTNLYASFINFTDGKVSLVEESEQKPFKLIPELVCTVINKDEKSLSARANIPLFKRVATTALDMENCSSDNKNDNDNLAWFIDLPTESKQSFTGTGAAIFCRVPFIFL